MVSKVAEPGDSLWDFGITQGSLGDYRNVVALKPILGSNYVSDLSMNCTRVSCDGFRRRMGRKKQAR